MARKFFYSDQIVDILRAACNAHPDKQKGWARDHGISAAFVSDIINGRRDPTERITECLGFERLMVFRKKR